MWREEDLSRIGIEASSGGGDGGDGVIVVNGGTGNAAGDPPHKTKVKKSTFFLSHFLPFFFNLQNDRFSFFFFFMFFMFCFSLFLS